LKRVGFILNHYDVHQVPHVVPYAFELSRLYDDIEVQLLCSSKKEADFAAEIAAGYEGHRCTIKVLPVPLLIRLLDPLLSKVVFARKSFVLSHNVKTLAGFDVLVVPEMTSLALKKKPGFEHIKMVRTSHGAGDRPGGSLNKRMGQFDLALLPGRKYADRLEELGYLPREKAAVCGYPKFEAMAHLGVGRKKLFENDRPVVVYNPHHTALQSSWHQMGEQVLDYFYQSREYNLIFAPHTVLFKRAWSKGARLPAKYKSTDNVLIDTGSRASSDMTYLRAGDIYLGDSSSQVYEFLENPRPCVFLNAHQADWQGDAYYRHWTFGPVIDDVGDLDAALKQAVAEQARFEPVQAKAVDYTFAKSDKTAGERGARAIARLLESGENRSNRAG
jgi:hypothetical protein